jgi:hypothetical protein
VRQPQPPKTEEVVVSSSKPTPKGAGSIITIQEAIAKLLSGEKLEWMAFRQHKGGAIHLQTPQARRLFHYLLSQPANKVSEGSEDIFPGLLSAWANDPCDPAKSKQTIPANIPTGTFRLHSIETEGFGGLNLFAGKPFFIETASESWCLEGQNGSGKTSLASAILWALTGQRIREHAGPVIDQGQREPVLDTAENKIGDWPPLAAYPTDRNDLNKDARVRVRLTFRDNTGAEAVAEREIISRADGTVVPQKQEVDPRLICSPQLIEAGLLMPSRLAHLSFGDKSQTLYEAVKMLTGLDQLGSIGDGAVALSNAGRKFLKYAKDQGIERLEADFSNAITAASQNAQEIGYDLSPVSRIGTKGVADELQRLASAASADAAKLALALKDEVAPDIDVSDPAGRRKLVDAVGAAKLVRQQATANIKAFATLNMLHAAHQQNRLQKLPPAIEAAEAELATALLWHKRQQEDVRLRLKALASQWYDVPKDEKQLAHCPLCNADLASPEQKGLARELQDLKKAADAAERKLEDVCATVRQTLTGLLAKELSEHIAPLFELEPKAAIVNAALQTFCEQHPFSDVLTKIAKTIRSAVDATCTDLPSFDPPPASPSHLDEPGYLADTRTYLSNLRRMLALGQWWTAHRETFAAFWQKLTGQVSEGEQPDQHSLSALLSAIETALSKVQPFDSVAKELKRAQNLARK